MSSRAPGLRGGAERSLRERYDAERDLADKFEGILRGREGTEHVTPSHPVVPPTLIDLHGRERHFHPARWRRPFEAAARAGFGVTLHLGEDFEDLLTGLRTVDEGLIELGEHEFPELRLSHLIAVRHRVEAWYARHAPVYVNTWEHLLSLLWLAGRVERTRALEEELAAVFSLERTYSARCSPFTERELTARIGSRAFACACRAKTDRSPGDWLDPPACANGWEDRPRAFAPSSELMSAIAEAQRGVQERLRKGGVQVEVCPTSNRWIAHTGLADLLVDPTDEVLLGSDDPGPMGTHVHLEAALRAVGRRR